MSCLEWQHYIVGTAAKELVEKGVDGFFLDNADVYYVYPTQDVFDGLSAIINELGQYGKDIIVNGGDVLVSKALLDGKNPLVSITGVNQECVFSRIDFGSHALLRQTPEETEYYLNYLEECRRHGLAIYLTEYVSPDQNKIKDDILGYCEEHGYSCYIAPSIWLDGV